MPSSADGSGPKPWSAEAPPGLLHNGAPIVSSQDAANYLGVNHGTLLHTLYKAPDNARYRGFEIPKRSGGMRAISAPINLIRTVQEKLAPVIATAYQPHPSAHGFLVERSIISNAKSHTGQRLVLNVDLADFFPSINFGRVRGLFMQPPFSLGPGAATIFAQICTHKNGLPQGAPTSPPLSNFIAATLDRRLTRLARENNIRYSRYADDITFSTNRPTFPASLAVLTQIKDGDKLSLKVVAGEALERAIAASGFSINHNKVRLQRHHERQAVTGLTVNNDVNVRRTRIRRIRALLHAWEKFGLIPAAREHFLKHRGAKSLPNNFERKFRNIVYGELAFVKMVRGKEDPVFLNLCAKLIKLDPNPSKFIRQMAFGADDFDVFISHASEDKDEIARPIFEACQKLGLKAFMDEAHIGWGQSYTEKINVALGSARTVLAIITNASVAKEWPVTEVNTALAMEVDGHKKVVPLLVGKPDLSRLPLIAGKDSMAWSNNADAVAARLQAAVKGAAPRRPAQAPPPRSFATRTSVPPIAAPEAPPPIRRKKGRGLFGWLFGRKK